MPLPAVLPPPEPLPAVKLSTSEQNLQRICNVLAVRKLEPAYLDALRELGATRIESGTDEEAVGTLYVCRDTAMASLAALSHAIDANKHDGVTLSKLVQQQSALLAVTHENIRLDHDMARTRKNEKRQQAGSSRSVPFGKISTPPVQINIDNRGNKPPSETTTHVINTE